ncbi:hypothetical protein OG21DRAFT_1010432 [Imleria badia]|nr:hypothetical protein OG21DRAFT_1010432 [Imleria badia]
MRLIFLPFESIQAPGCHPSASVSGVRSSCLPTIVTLALPCSTVCKLPFMPCRLSSSLRRTLLGYVSLSCLSMGL